jgi:uncharacterized protein (TIGR02594 family)
MAMLRRGSVGPEVRQLQTLLNSRLSPSPGLTVDGIFGPMTERAVLRFQKANGVMVDGIVGQQTWEKLTGTPGSPAPAPAPGLPDNDDTPRWMAIAQAEMQRGVHELAGSNHNSRIVEYHQTTTLRATDDETSWCSSFVNWCMRQAGQQGTNLANARSWLDWGQALDEPRKGCVVVLWRGSRTGWQGHVAFFNGKSGSQLSLLGGNQSDSVCISNYPSSQLLGYRWPTQG